ncbi:hypothetical protein EK21DRAFT_110111 [Setomelanomma holmii]|uniref:Uncharacterized protein n=1 Tax=Setomelanomma holmii TaxID=210430 RepID=A0A9P4HD61_9PLEO|nr:hypothetical protein EK21DRAFT_110111 [Setomelanomma holmii]
MTYRKIHLKNPASDMLDTFHRWSLLPDELKLMILGIRLQFEKAIESKRHGSISRRVLLPLTVYYGKNVVQLAPVGAQHSPRLEGRRFAYPQPSIGMFVRNLEVHFIVPFKANDLFRFEVGRLGTCDADWTYLFVDGAQPDLAHRAEWRKGLAKLVRLKIVVEFEQYLAPGDLQPCTQPNLTEMLDSMTRMRIPIHANHVEVHVPGLDCGSTPGCSGGCADAIAATISGMLEPHPEDEDRGEEEPHVEELPEDVEEELQSQTGVLSLTSGSLFGG